MRVGRPTGTHINRHGLGGAADGGGGGVGHTGLPSLVGPFTKLEK